MDSNHKQLIASLERIQAFLNRYPLPNPPAKFAERRAEVDEVLPRLTALAFEQSAAQRESRDGTRRQQTARQVLLEALAPISRVGLAVLPQDPEIQKSMAMPDAKIATGKLLAIAGGMRSSAAQYEKLLQENGCAADCLAKLDAAIDGVRLTVIGKAQSVGRHVGAKAGLDQELKRARRTVKMLDAIVRNAFAGRADMLATWRVAKRVKETNGSSFRGNGGTADENLEPQQAA